MTIDKVKDMLASQLNISKDKIKEDSKIVEDLGADSLDIVELLMTLEEESGIVVSDEDAQKIKTIQDIVNLVDKK